MEARNQMVSLFSNTINDFNDLISSSADLEHEDNKKVLGFANKAVNKLKELKASITDNGFVDTVENMETVDMVRQTLGDLRTKMFAMSATDASIDKLLNTLGRGVTQLQEADIRGKVAKKVSIESYGEDDLVCATKVTSWLNESASFIKNLKAIMDDHPTMEKLVVLSPSEDEEYKSLLEQINEYEELAATAETDEEADLYMQELEDLEQLKKDRVEEINEINREKREERAQKMQERKTGYERVLKLLQSIYKQYTGRSFVSYKKRAEILERSGIGSFDDIFEQLSEARAEGDATTILMVEGKLNVIIEEYEKSKESMKKAETTIQRTQEKERLEAQKAQERVEQLKRERMGITEDPVQEKEDAEKKARMERLAALRAKRGVTAEQPTKEPEVGTVEKVNVKEEKDPWADLLKKEKI